MIHIIESTDSFCERSASDCEMKIKLSTLLNSIINVELLSGREIEDIREIANHFELELTKEKLSKI